MITASLQLKNIGPFDGFILRPQPGLTVLRGPNGSGKTTLCNAVLYLIEKNHDPSLIKGYPNLKDGIFGEIRLIISDPGHEYDGANYVCTITADRTTRVLHHPKLVKIPVAQSKKWIEEVINVISLDPSRFLTASDNEQVEIFLRAQPQRVTADQLAFLPAEFLKKVDLDKHALEVLGDKDSGIYGALYAARAAVKKEGDVKAKYALQLRTTLPADPVEGNWSETYQKKSGELSELRTSTQAKISAIRNDAKSAIDAQDALFYETKSQLEKELRAAIEKLEADTQLALEIARKKCSDMTASIVANRDVAMEAAKSDYEPKNNALVSEISQAKTMIDQHAKTQATLDMAVQAETGATECDIKAKSYTEFLKKVEALKADLLKETPIPGLEIMNGILALDGTPLRRVNDADAHMRVCFSLGKMMAGPLGFIIMDNAEKFDEDHLPMVEKIASELGIQIVLTIATVKDENGDKIAGLKASNGTIKEVA